MRLTNRLLAASAGVLFAAPLWAAEPGVPAKFISGETMMVARVNLQHLKTQMIKDTFSAVIDAGALGNAGVENPLETDELKQMIAGMGMMEGFAQSFVGMGATSVSIVMQAPEDEFSQPTMQVLIPSSSGESSEQIIQMLNMMGGMGSMAKPVNEGGQNWVVFSPMGEVTDGGNAAAAGHFNSALTGMEGASISFVMLPIEKMRAQMLDNVEDEEQAALARDIMDNTKWMGMSISLGGEPSIKMTSELKDAAAADKVNGHWKKLLGTLTEKAKEAEAEQEEWPEDAPKPTEMAKKITKAASMETSGNRVNVVFDKNELRELTTMFVIFADRSGISPMDFMPAGGF